MFEKLRKLFEERQVPPSEAAQDAVGRFIRSPLCADMDVDVYYDSDGSGAVVEMGLPEQPHLNAIFTVRPTRGGRGVELGHPIHVVRPPLRGPVVAPPQPRRNQ